MVSRGQIWAYEHPDRKRRPVLILTRDEIAAGIFDVIAVPATSEIRGVPTEVELGIDDGMDRDCVLSLHNTLLAQKVFLTHRITTLSAARRTEVCHKLNYATSC